MSEFITEPLSLEQLLERFDGPEPLVAVRFRFRIDLDDLIYAREEDSDLERHGLKALCENPDRCGIVVSHCAAVAAEPKCAPYARYSGSVVVEAEGSLDRGRLRREISDAARERQRQQEQTDAAKQVIRELRTCQPAAVAPLIQKLSYLGTIASTAAAREIAAEDAAPTSAEPGANP